MNCAKALEIQRELVISWWNSQALKKAVEVVDDAGVIAVDEDSGVLRLDLEAYTDTDRVERRIVPEGISCRRPPGIWSKKRIVKKSADEDGSTAKRAASPLRKRRCGTRQQDKSENSEGDSGYPVQD
jgi:hypothetical protein